MSLREKIGNVIFETDTPLARGFDIALLWAILLSILLVIIESVTQIRQDHGAALRAAEWVFTILFTVEYALRVYSATKRLRYLTSFLGVIDLLAVLPTYLSLLFVGTQYFLVLRALRLLRVFRVLKLRRHLGEANILAKALSSSIEKITVFLVTVLTLVLLIGSTMYLVEGPPNGFINIPVSIYWAIVTLTTVGYGDISPQTPLGQFLAAMVMIIGYAIIAVPTGIVTTELSRAQHDRERNARTCEHCGARSMEADDAFCRKCGEAL
jgi:voltage-gated potassium channel